MAMYSVFDGHVVSNAEYLSRAAEINNHLNVRISAGAKGLTALTLSGGRELSGTAPLAQPNPLSATPIARGKPLSVYILHVYTGKYPERGLFGSRGDMAIVSGVKSFSAFEASARALNYLQPAVKPNSHFLAPVAFTQGTPLVLYSPAVTDSSITVTLEMATANDFVHNLLDQIGNGFQTLAGIPLLLPYAGYLMGAGSLLKLGEGVADALYQASPAVSHTEVINFGLAFTELAQAETRIVCNSSFDPTSYTYKDRIGLVNQSNQPYDGGEPYVVIALDGTQHDEWKGFTPSVASAAILQKFFSAKSGSQTAIDAFVGAVGVASDLKYRNQALAIKQQLAGNPANASELQEQYNAIIKNIVDPALVPK